MSLDITLTKVIETEVFEANITHNLGMMAQAAGIYQVLWRPEELGATQAKDIIPELESGLAKLKSMPNLKEYNPTNGWGDYDGLVEFVERYLKACKENPDATIHTWR